MNRFHRNFVAPLCLATVFFCFGVCTQAQANPPLPDAPGFISAVGLEWNRLKQNQTPDIPTPVLGRATFLPLTALIRGQSEISVDNIYAKLSEHLQNGDLKWQGGTWTHHFDEGNSILDLQDAISAIKGPQGYVITDGHHDLYLSIFTGASTISVVVTEDLSHLSPLQFWMDLKKRNLTLLQESPRELALTPPEMSMIRDNANRYLAALVALKVQAERKNGNWVVKKAKGSKNALWVKLNNGIPFIEFYLAEAITAAGVKYSTAWGTDVPSDVVEKMREAFLSAGSSPHANLIKKLVVFTEAQSENGVPGDFKKLAAELKRVYGRRRPTESPANPN